MTDSDSDCSRTSPSSSSVASQSRVNVPGNGYQGSLGCVYPNCGFWFVPSNPRIPRPRFNKAFFPPPPYEKIPQRPYVPHNNGMLPPNDPRQPVKFHLNTNPPSFLPVLDALNGNFVELEGRDNTFDDSQSLAKENITIRIRWPGYKSWDHQVKTRDWSAARNPISKARLAFEVAKALKLSIERAIQDKEEIDPAFEEWKVGAGGIELGSLYLAAIKPVSKGSWQPEFYRPTNAAISGQD